MDQGFYQRRRPARAAHQVVDIVEPLSEVIELPPGASPGHLHRAPFAQAPQMRAALAGIEPGAFRDLPRRRRLPEISQREIHPPFLCGQRIEVALEILGVVVNQI